MSFVLFGTVSQCCDATSILDGIICPPPWHWAFWIQFQIFNLLSHGGSFVYSPLAAITHFLGVLDLDA